MMAPVAGSGSWPTWIARVSKSTPWSLEAPDGSVVRHRDEGAGGRRRDAERRVAGRDGARDGVVSRVDDRDRVRVDVRHPELAADPGAGERVRADADGCGHLPGPGIEPIDAVRLARYPQGAVAGRDPV